MLYIPMQKDEKEKIYEAYLSLTNKSSPILILDNWGKHCKSSERKLIFTFYFFYISWSLNLLLCFNSPVFEYTFKQKSFLLNER